MVRSAKSQIGQGKTVSCKIRTHKDLTDDSMGPSVEQAGVDFITVHGRRRSQRSSTPPHYAAIKTIKESVNVPVLANGDTYNIDDVHKIAALTKADGVMAARGILENPALFTGYKTTPIDCVHKFLEHAIRHPIPYPLVLHHISEMTARMPSMNKGERKRLMACQDLPDLIDFIEDKWRKQKKSYDPMSFLQPNGSQQLHAVS